MKKKPKKTIASNLLRIYKSAAESNDGQRCMISPSPEVKEQLKEELKRLKNLSNNELLSSLLTPKQENSVGFNDGLVMPGNVFPLGTSASSVRARSMKRKKMRNTLRVIVFLAEFPDKKINLPKKHYEDLFFSKGVVKTGSVREYFKEVTNGKVDIRGEVVGPFMLPKKITEYAGIDSGVQRTEPNARTMALHATVAADPVVNFKNYDNDNDGYVDAFVIIHAGRGAEQTASTKDIWSHKWVLPNEYNADGTGVYAYLTVPEDCRLGVCAHELGHLLFGFPDLYDTDYTSEGVGEWCLMGAGSWNNSGLTPAHPCAWCKIQQGWVEVSNPTKNQSSVKIEAVQKTNKVFRLWKNGTQGNEYFLVENRQQKKYDKYIPGNGLLIWHIDDGIDDNSNELHYRVALMQADGRRDLEKGNNAGDPDDAWPGTRAKKVFNQGSNPNSLSYGGLDTSVQVNIIKTTGESVVADLMVAQVKPPTKSASKTNTRVRVKKIAAPKKAASRKKAPARSASRS